MEQITNDIVERGVETFCPASAGCPKDQRTSLILKSVSETFHERALKVRSGFPGNLIASAESPPKRVTVPLFKRDLKESRLMRDLSYKIIVNMNNESPSTAVSRNNGDSTDQADPGPFERPKLLTLHTQEKIDPRLQQGYHENSDTTHSKPRLSSGSTGHAVLFESVVYPALKKSKKRHKDSLPREELDAIGKTVSLTSM